jgi:hypothetical protein
MKILILNLLFGTIMIVVRFEAPDRHQLSHRLNALRHWPSHRNRQPGH